MWRSARVCRVRFASCVAPRCERPVDAVSAPVDDCDDAVVAVDADAVAGLDPLGC